MRIRSNTTGQKLTETVNATKYQFINLTPDTEYTIRIGASGFGPAQNIHVKTLPKGAKSFDNQITIEAEHKPHSDKISIQRHDANQIGENAYHIERLVASQAKHILTDMPVSGTSYDHIRSDWLGKAVSYRVFEWYGAQKLYSNSTASVTLPGSLQQPQNLTATLSYNEGIGYSATLAWDDAPLFSNYVIQQWADSKWTTIKETQDNSATISPSAAGEKYRILAHMDGAFSTPATITISERTG